MSGINLENSKIRFFFIISIASFLSVLVFMLRKHWEFYLFTLKQSFWYDIGVIQVDNSFWEGLAKLLVLFLALRIKKLKPWVTGYWIGLYYGTGEAVMLALLMIYPGYAHYFSLNTFGLFLQPGFIYERFWAIQIHAVIGAILGVGAGEYLSKKKVKTLVFFFLLAMLYHIFVDGNITFLWYFPATAKYYPPAVIALPVIVGIGYFIMYLAVKLRG